MAKAGKKTSVGVLEWSTPTLSEIHFASATLGPMGGLGSGAKRVGKLVDDLKSPAGTPRKYDYAAIIAVTREAIKLSVNAHQSWFLQSKFTKCVSSAVHRSRHRMTIAASNGSSATFTSAAQFNYAAFRSHFSRDLVCSLRH